MENDPSHSGSMTPEGFGEYMKLRSCKKLYSKETQRAVSLDETLLKAESRLPAAGITRVADITQLDRVGIPVFSCIRPTAKAGAITVYNGKGATPLAARVSAMMEGIERYSGEYQFTDPVIRTYREMGMEGLTLNPADLILPLGSDPEAPLMWVEGHDLVSNQPILVPAHAVYHPLPKFVPPLFRTSTNGLASGNTLEEAVFHALAEVIERDAWSLVETLKDAGPRIVLTDDTMVGEMANRFTSNGIDIQLRDITSDIGIPTIAAVADDVMLKDPALLTIGMGTHTNATIAAIRALSEVAQSRLTQIHGAREDTTVAEFRKKMGYERTKRINRHWFETKNSVEFNEIHSCDTPDFLDDITLILRTLHARGIEQVIAVDLTRPEIDIPVVRVIVPGLEIYAIDPDRRGERCRHAQDHRFSRPITPA